MFKVVSVLLSLLIIIALAKGDINNCMEKNDITIEEINKFNVDSKDPNYHAERKIKCFAQCLADSLFSKDADGKYIMNTFYEGDVLITPNEAKIAKSKECNEKVDKVKDLCEYAFFYLNCVQDKVN